MLIDLHYPIQILQCGKKIRTIDANVTSESGSTDYEYKGAIGDDDDTIYIAPNISVPAGYPGNRLILIIAVYFILYEKEN